MFSQKIDACMHMIFLPLLEDCLDCKPSHWVELSSLFVVVDVFRRVRCDACVCCSNRLKAMVMVASKSA